MIFSTMPQDLASMSRQAIPKAGSPGPDVLRSLASRAIARLFSSNRKEKAPKAQTQKQPKQPKAKAPKTPKAKAPKAPKPPSGEAPPRQPVNPSSNPQQLARLKPFFEEHAPNLQSVSYQGQVQYQKPGSKAPSQPVNTLPADFNPRSTLPRKNPMSGAAPIAGAEQTEVVAPELRGVQESIKPIHEKRAQLRHNTLMARADYDDARQMASMKRTPEVMQRLEAARMAHERALMEEYQHKQTMMSAMRQAAGNRIRSWGG